MFELVLNIALFLLSFSILLAIIRVIKGPTTPDRVIALDTIGINLMGVTAIVSLLLKTEVFLEVIMLIGALAFIGTVAFAKYLEKGAIIDAD